MNIKGALIQNHKAGHMTKELSHCCSINLIPVWATRLHAAG